MNLEYLHRPSNRPQNEPKPLLVLLHGYGSNMQDLFSFSPDIPSEYEVIAMNAPLTTPYGGSAWYDINLLNAEKFNDTQQAQESMRKILEDIDEHCELWNCQKNAVNLCGFSQGGILSYAMGLNHSKEFHKVLCLSAYPAADVIGDFDKNSDFSNMKFFISHGIEDAVIPFDWGKKGETLMQELQIDYVFRAYEEGHGVNPQNYHDLIHFLS